MIRLTRARLVLLCAVLLLLVVTAAPIHWAILAVLLLPYWLFVALAPSFSASIVEQSYAPQNCLVLPIFSPRPPPVR